MYQVTYACGCTEEGPGLSFAHRCPMHDSPAFRAFQIGTTALTAAYGKAAEEPAGPLFRPVIEGMKTWKTA